MTWSAPAAAASWALAGLLIGGDHGGVGPAGELDGRVADRARSTGDQDDPAGQRPRSEPARPLLGDGQAPVGRDERHPQGRAQVEARRVRAGTPPGEPARSRTPERCLPGVGRPPPRSRPAVRAAPPRHRPRPRPPRPAPSWFGTCGGSTGSPGVLPWRDFQSVGLTPDRWIWTRTSPGPGSRSGRSTTCRTSGSPVWLYVAARLVIPPHWHVGAQNSRSAASAAGSSSASSRRLRSRPPAYPVSRPPLPTTR